MPGGTEENDENPQIGYLASGPRNVILGPPEYEAGVLTT
jgi:hypothetical protein